MNPFYEHDCDKCVYLGSLDRSVRVYPHYTSSDASEGDGTEYTSNVQKAYCFNETKEIDLYFCKQGRRYASKGPFDTVSARYSDEGSDYVSGLNLAKGLVPDLVIALSIARAKGLIR